MNPNEQQYLGDGLFAKLDKWGRVILSAPREEEEHFVVLEPEVLAAFLRFIGEANKQESTQ